MLALSVSQRVALQSATASCFAGGDAEAACYCQPMVAQKPHAPFPPSSDAPQGCIMHVHTQHISSARSSAGSWPAAPPGARRGG
ncbi:MAG: hypothetical protein WDW38_009868 [Sanguina aurantia]